MSNRKVSSLKKGWETKERLDEIKYLLKTAQISYDTAKEQAEIPLKILNKRMEGISKRFGRKHHKVRFITYMR